MKQTIITLLAVAILALGAGFLLGKSHTTRQYAGYVELHRTNSGTFILNKDRIYTVSELVTDARR